MRTAAQNAFTYFVLSDEDANLYRRYRAMYNVYYPQIQGHTAGLQHRNMLPRTVVGVYSDDDSVSETVAILRA